MMTPEDLAAKAKSSPQFADLLLPQVDDLVYVVDREYRTAFLNNGHPLFQPHNSAATRCYETVMGLNQPCDFCALQPILGGRQSSLNQVINRQGKPYRLAVSRLICEDGLPLCLHLMRDISAAQRRGLAFEADRRSSTPRVERRRYQQTSLAGIEALLGVSENWLVVKGLIRELAQFPTVAVLIVGETGTGKELVAQALHQSTFGAAAPFIPFNCSAIPEHLLESELFGYERGAFTGASRTKKGLFELAHGGTLLLDEIGDLSPTLQPKLLRVLETKRFTRLGGTHGVAVDFRLLCATNKPLRAMVAEGKFRQDLYHRLNTFTIALVPLRERPEDIPLLVDTFIAEANLRLGKDVNDMSSEALALLRDYPWPGNVRELKNVIERAVILTTTNGQIDKTTFPPEMFPLLPGAGAPMLSLRDVERQHLEKTLARCRGNKSQAAKFLRISRTTLRKKLQDYNLI